MANPPLKIQRGGLQVRFRTPAGTARAPYL
nr:MAG TPA: hypothetical protein [Caudoviricetes sp.]